MKISAPQGEVEFTERVAFRCPCGGTARVGFGGKDGEGEPMVLHTVPECRAMHEHDLNDYLRWARDNGCEVLS